MYILSTLCLMKTIAAVVQFDIRRESDHLDLMKRSSGSSEVPLENTLSFYQTELLIGNPPQAVIVQVDTGSSDLWLISSKNPYCGTPSVKCPAQSTFDSKKSTSFKCNKTSIFAIAYGDSTFASGNYVQDDIQIGGIDFEPQSGHRTLGPSGYKGSTSQGEWVPNESTPLIEGSHGDSNEKQHEKNASSGTGKFIIHNANFALAERVNSSEAIWGIGMETTESMARHVNSHGELYPTYPNLPTQMKDQGFIETVSYSLWLNDLHSSSGSLLFGAVDHSKYLGQLQTVPLVNAYQDIASPIDFSVMLHGIAAYNSANEAVEIVKCSVPVLLDSGTTYSQLPKPLIEPIVTTIGGIFDSKENVYLVTETQKHNLQGGGIRFNLSGIEIDVNLDELLIPIGPLKRTPRSNGASSQKNEEILFNTNLESDSDDYADENLDSQEGSFNNDGSVNEAISSSSVKAHKRTENYYILGIFPVDQSASGAYILGDTFLRSAYVVYDLEHKEIALANTYYNSTDSQVDIIGSKGIPSAKHADAYSSTKISHEIIVFNEASLFNSTDKKSDTPKTSANTSIVQSHTQTLEGVLSRTALFNSKSSKHSGQNQFRRQRGHHTNGAERLDCLVSKYFLSSIFMILYYIF